MRYSADHKEATRQSILEQAASLFQGTGTAASIPLLMRKLSLTHGGFYRHFVSKSHLFEEAVAWSAANAAARLAARGRRRAALMAIISVYLSEAHCADIAGGCPIAALGPEIARLRARQRDACGRALNAYVGSLAPFVPGATAAQRRERAALVLSSMAGTLILARTTGDARARRRLLRAARTYHAFAALA